MGCCSQRGVCCARVRRWVVGSCQRPCRRADLTGGEGPADSSDARGTPGAPRRRHRGALTSGRKGTGDSQPLFFFFSFASQDVPDCGGYTMPREKRRDSAGSRDSCSERKGSPTRQRRQARALRERAQSSSRHQDVREWENNQERTTALALIKGDVPAPGHRRISPVSRAALWGGEGH